MSFDSVLVALGEDLLVCAIMYNIYLLIRIFKHESTSFYSQISCLTLCAGLLLRSTLIFCDSLARF